MFEIREAAQPSHVRSYFRDFFRFFFLFWKTDLTFGKLDWTPMVENINIFNKPIRFFRRPIFGKFGSKFVQIWTDFQKLNDVITVGRFRVQPKFQRNRANLGFYVAEIMKDRRRGKRNNKVKILSWIARRSKTRDFDGGHTKIGLRGCNRGRFCQQMKLGAYSRRPNFEADRYCIKIFQFEIMLSDQCCHTNGFIHTNTDFGHHTELMNRFLIFFISFHYFSW